MKTKILLTLLVSFGFTGCTNSLFPVLGAPSLPSVTKTPTPVVSYTQNYQAPTPEKSEQYSNTMRKVASGIPNDSQYSRIALDTPEKKAWFKTLTYRLWDRQITRYEFMQQGLAKYPTHRYEFNFIIKGFSA